MLPSSRAPRRAFLALALAATLPLGLAACTATEPNPPAEVSESITYAVPLTIAAAAAYVADDQGFWAEEGIDVKLELFDSGRQALDALLAHDAEVMSVSETPPLRAVLQGQEIRWIATVAEHHEAKLTVRTDVISKPEDLVGHKIGTVVGTNSDYYMYRWLEAHDIRPDDVDILAMDPPTMVQAFVQGDIDAMFAWEPHNFNAYSQIPDLSASWPTELYSGRHSIIMNADYLSAHKAAAEKIIAGFIKAEGFISEHPAEAKAIVEKVTGIDAAVLDSLWDEYVVKVELDNGLLSILGDEAQWISETDGVKQLPDFADFIDAAPMLAVESERVGTDYK